MARYPMPFALASLLIVVLTGPSDAVPAFSAASLKGTFAFGFSGLESSGGIVSTGVLTFDGTNAVTGRASVRLEGGGDCKGVIRSSTYQVKADGTGQLSLGFFADPPCVMSMALPLNIAASSADAFELSSGQGVFSGRATRQDAGAFTAASVAGSYAFGLSGFDGATATVATGVMTLDGAGKVTGTATFKKAGGSACSGTIRSSTYGVDAGGTGFMSLGFFPDSCAFSEALPLSIALLGPQRGFELASAGNSLYSGTAKIQKLPVP